MSLHSLLQDLQRRGPALICVGLLVVLAGQIWPVVPVVSALLLIGWGTTLTVFARSNDGSGSLAFLNTTVYALLSCLAIAAQTHAASRGSSLPMPTIVDHATAVVLLVALVRYTLCQLPFGRASGR